MSQNQHGKSYKSLGDYSTHASGAALAGTILVNKYRLVHPLGEGGMGVVWLAYDTVGQRSVALKFLQAEQRRDSLEVERTKSTFRRVCELQHQHVCPTLDLGADPKVGYFLVMKHVVGLSLAEHRRAWCIRHGALPLGEVIRILKQIAAGLDYIHSKGIVHRDIKPENILVEKGGDVQIVDFGLASDIDSQPLQGSATRPTWGGTYPYMAPEQWKGEVQDGRTDQYSLAVIGFWMLSGGMLPFEAATSQKLREMVLHAPIPEMPGVSKVLWSTVARGLAKESDRRFPNCAAFVESLASGSSHPPPPPCAIPPTTDVPVLLQAAVQREPPPPPVPQLAIPPATISAVSTRKAKGQSVVSKPLKPGLRTLLWYTALILVCAVSVPVIVTISRPPSPVASATGAVTDGRVPGFVTSPHASQPVSVPHAPQQVSVRVSERPIPIEVLSTRVPRRQSVELVQYVNVGRRSETPASLGRFDLESLEKVGLHSSQTVRAQFKTEPTPDGLRVDFDDPRREAIFTLGVLRKKADRLEFTWNADGVAPPMEQFLRLGVVSVPHPRGIAHVALSRPFALPDIPLTGTVTPFSPTDFTPRDSDVATEDVVPLLQRCLLARGVLRLTKRLPPKPGKKEIPPHEYPFALLEGDGERTFKLKCDALGTELSWQPELIQLAAEPMKPTKPLNVLSNIKEALTLESAQGLLVPRVDLIWRQTDENGTAEIRLQLPRPDGGQEAFLSLTQVEDRLKAVKQMASRSDLTPVAKQNLDATAKCLQRVLTVLKSPADLSCEWVEIIHGVNIERLVFGDVEPGKSEPEEAAKEPSAKESKD